MKITTENITDEQIRELRRRLLIDSDNQCTDDVDQTGMALWNTDDPKFDSVRATAIIVKQIARERCTELLITRAVTET